MRRVVEARNWPLSESRDESTAIRRPGDSAAASDDRTKRVFLLVEPNQTQLKEIGRLLDAGRLQPVVDGVVPLSRVGEAYAGKITHRLGRGKLVVDLLSDQPGVPVA